MNKKVIPQHIISITVIIETGCLAKSRTQWLARLDASKTQRSSCLCFPRSEVTGAWCYSWLFSWIQTWVPVLYSEHFNHSPFSQFQEAVFSPVSVSIWDDGEQRPFSGGNKKEVIFVKRYWFWEVSILFINNPFSSLSSIPLHWICHGYAWPLVRHLRYF